MTKTTTETLAEQEAAVRAERRAEALKAGLLPNATAEEAAAYYAMRDAQDQAKDAAAKAATEAEQARGLRVSAEYNLTTPPPTPEEEARIAAGHLDEVLADRTAALEPLRVAEAEAVAKADDPRAAHEALV